MEENLSKGNIRLKAGIEYQIKNYPLDPKVSLEAWSNIVDL